MISCKELAKKIMTKERMSFMEKLEYYMHLAMCTACRIFKRQMDNFDETSKVVIEKKAQECCADKEELKKELLKKYGEE